MSIFVGLVSSCSCTLTVLDFVSDLRDRPLPLLSSCQGEEVSYENGSQLRLPTRDSHPKVRLYVDISHVHVLGEVRTRRFRLRGLRDADRFKRQRE